MIIELSLLALAVLMGAAAASVLWQETREAIASWLRDHGLAQSALMDAFVMLERAVTDHVIARVTVRTRQYGQQQIRTRQYRLDELDKDMRELVRKHNVVRLPALQLLQSD
jgi:hypothetical protein